MILALFDHPGKLTAFEDVLLSWLFCLGVILFFAALSYLKVGGRR